MFALAKALTVTQGNLTPRGIEMIFENGDTRTEIRVVPKVYTAQRVIVDAINDLNLIVEAKSFRLRTDGDGRAPVAEPIFQERIEIPLSAWLGEDYL